MSLTIKRVINGKRYDTTTAKELYHYDSGHFAGDFEGFSESLYRKKTGEFFLAGEGGPASKYSRKVRRNEWSSGQDIIPIDADDARLWLQRYADSDTYQMIFGPASE